jgi:hypothetical protein
MAIRDLTLGLLSAGHYPMVYSPELGDIAREISDAGIPVVSDLHLLPYEPDIIHGQHYFETLKAFSCFPKTFGIFVCHDSRSWHDMPPRSARIRRYMAVDQNCRERLERFPWIPRNRIGMIYNWVDTDRFLLRPPLPKTPKRALVFSNYASTNTLKPFHTACKKLGIDLDIIGLKSGNSIDQPEKFLGQYDLVFAKARCAIESMATGTAVILCDTKKIGQMVMIDEVEKLRPWNFGRRCLKHSLEPERIISEIRRYNPDDAFAVSRYIRKNANLPIALEQYLSLYNEVILEASHLSAQDIDDSAEYPLSFFQRIADLKDRGIVRIMSKKVIIERLITNDAQRI